MDKLLFNKKANSGGALVWERIYPFYQFTYNHVPTDICVDKEQNVLVSRTKQGNSSCTL
ncbi:MAG: hypothetical protein IPG99_17080 [Ignavibacteria bacterium]|nr:hypothetical protein [Ignavibacteria bacterium]